MIQQKLYKSFFYSTFLLVSSLLVSCTEENVLEKALSSSNKEILKVVEDIDKHEVQILFTEVIEENGKTVFKDYSFQVNDSNYFYPASTVKFPVAILALEKLNKNSKVHRNTPFVIDSLRTTFTNEINKLFAVSDNLAYTRLFEYLGQDYIDSELEKRGIHARISHRFSVPEPYALETKSLYFYEKDSLVFSSKTTTNNSIRNLTLNKLIKGKGYLTGDSLVNKPMNFSLKNYFPLTSQHNLMKQLMFPELYPEERRFNLSKEDRAYVIHAMSNVPRYVGYDANEYYDSYVKFFLFGDSKQDIPKHIKIHNKVGYAYGYLTDCAFIVNEQTNKKYIITATIHVNKNQIYNDGVYEYEEIGIPFLAELGRQLTN